MGSGECTVCVFSYNIDLCDLTLSRPRSREELFNLRHASARNVIERIFGVLKHRYRVLQLPLEYSLEIQSCLPASLAAVHNFILIHTPVDGNAPDNTDEVEVGGDEHLYQGGDPFAAGDGEENHANVGVEAGVMRDDMAQRMWDDYQAILLGREDLGDSDSSDILDGIDALHL